MKPFQVSQPQITSRCIAIKTLRDGGRRDQVVPVGLYEHQAFSIICRHGCVASRASFLPYRYSQYGAKRHRQCAIRYRAQDLSEGQAQGTGTYHRSRWAASWSFRRETVLGARMRIADAKSPVRKGQKGLGSWVVGDRRR